MKSKISWWVHRAGCGRRVARFARLSLVVSFMCSLLAASASAAPNVYVVTLSQQFGTVDLATGQFTPIGSPTPDGMSNLVWWNGSLLSLATTGADAGYLLRSIPRQATKRSFAQLRSTGNHSDSMPSILPRLKGGSM
jgi:hypothetical protein